MLVVKGVNKSINHNLILSNIELTLKPGVVYGFVGRNGSGKTMLFRALSGLMKIDSGEIIYQDKRLHKDFPVLPRLGITLENAGLYPEFTGLKNLQLLAKLNKIIGDEEIKDAIRRVGLDPNDKRIYKKYSLGMKQRIVLAQAIMEKPEVIMLDEPTNSLDEVGVSQIRQVIKEEKQRGAMILLASHNKEDIELLADDVFYLDKGRLVNNEVLKHAE
ncbi:ABC transporter ATP-binding protein [Bacillus alkalicellulosilyticus]|uniref:ABC transporter ATP-binding protein n=1 Tax=Alkalihalobacterium alkalicellulosilyticum TaxID=1912214 RepID=UPI000995E25B|nr:ATP-binding cassette domain-containing protein [Bacillus alkalicellulosilyticus]